MADAHYPYEFEENTPFFSKGRLYSSIQFVGGTDRALIVTCKESLLHYRKLRSIIDSYAPVPLLGRIHPTIVKALANQWSDSPLLNLTYFLLPESEIPQTLAVHSIDGALNTIPALTSEEKLVSYLHSSLLSSTTFHVLSSSLLQDQDETFIQGSPRVTLNNMIALLKSSIIESIEMKSAFTLMSLRTEAGGRESYS